MDVPPPVEIPASVAPPAIQPVFVEPPDSAVLVERARQVVRNLPGCFNMKGDARDRFDAGIFGKGERHWILEGTLIGGLWSPYTASVAADSPDKPDPDEKRNSIFGRTAESEESSNEGRQSILQALQDDVTMEYVEKHGEGWRLIRTLRGGNVGRNLLTLGFDSAWNPHHFAITIVDPVVVKGERGRGKIVSMDVSLDTDAQGAPASERLDGVFAAWPFSVEVHAVTTWTATPCGT